MFKLNNLIRPNIASLQAYSSARNEFMANSGIFLDANENPYGDLNRYPDPQNIKLRQKIAELRSIPVQNIFTGNGSDEAIDLCLRIFCEPGRDKAMTFVPTYGMYEVSAGINNITLLKVPLTRDFQIDFDTVFDVLKDDSIKLIFLCSPNNPTGNCIKGILELAANFEGIVVIDEAYADFADTSLLDTLHNYPNLIVLQTLSKAWGLAAARIGLAFASEDIIALFDKVKPPYNISTLNSDAAMMQLDKIAEYKVQRDLLIEERKNLSQTLELLPLVSKVYPSDANFILIKVIDAAAIYQNLLQQGIIVRNRDSVIKNTIRITVGTPEQNQILLTALKNMTL